MELHKVRTGENKFKSKSKSNRSDNPFRSFRNSRNDSYSRNDRYSRDDRRGESTTVTCADCGTEWVLNVKFHLFQKLIGQYTVVIVSDKTNHKIPETIDTPEMIEVQDIPETIDTPEMIEVQDIPETIDTPEMIEGENLQP
jgi:hypothetical protein